MGLRSQNNEIHTEDLRMLLPKTCARLSSSHVCKDLYGSMGKDTFALASVKKHRNLSLSALLALADTDQSLPCERCGKEGFTTRDHICHFPGTLFINSHFPSYHIFPLLTCHESTKSLNLYDISNQIQLLFNQPLIMATELSLLVVMDRLWFHQTILFSEPSPMFLLPESCKTPLSTSHSSHCSSKNSSQVSLISEQDASLDGSLVTFTGPLEDESSSPEIDHDMEKTNEERRKRSNLPLRKNRAQSSSPTATEKQSRKRLQKCMSCKSLWELELEEVKGFMDLGFVFEKEKLSKRIMDLIPGLHKIDAYQKDEIDNFELKDDGFEGEEEEKIIMRPYLSEAWVVKRPDSPLLNLRVPRVSAAVDMKKHLKYWARTVASAIQQES